MAGGRRDNNTAIGGGSNVGNADLGGLGLGYGLNQGSSSNLKISEDILVRPNTTAALSGAGLGGGLGLLDQNKSGLGIGIGFGIEKTTSVINGGFGLGSGGTTNMGIGLGLDSFEKGLKLTNPI